MADQETGYGWGNVQAGGSGGSSTQTVQDEGTYTDAQGRKITREQALSSGSVDAPGAASAVLQRIGATTPGATTETEQRLAREDIAKRQVQEGRFTAQEIQGAKRMLESQTAEFAGRTPEQRAAMRQALYEQVVYREPGVRPATRYIPYQANQKAIDDIKRTLGIGAPITSAQRALTPTDKIRYTSEADIRYVTIGGKQRIFINPALVRQKDIFGDIERKVSGSLKANVPVAVSEFVDMVDRRAQASFTGPRSKNPFALRNVAESVFGIERGIVKGAVEQPLTTGGSLALGFGASKIVGAASKGLPILTKGIGAGKVTGQISALNVAGGAMAGYYGADVASRIAKANDRYEKLGEILGSELIPFVAGARLSNVPISANIKTARIQLRNAAKLQTKTMDAFVKSEAARMDVDVWSRIPTPRQSAIKAGKELERTIEYGKKFAEPKGSGVAVSSGRQQLIAIQETKMQPQIQKQVVDLAQLKLKNTQTLEELLKVPEQKAITKTKTVQIQDQITETIQKQALKHKQLQALLLLPVRSQIQITEQKQATKTEQAYGTKQHLQQIYKPLTIQNIKTSAIQLQQNIQTTRQIFKQIQEQATTQATQQATRQITKQETRQIQEQKVVIIPKSFKSQLATIAKERKKKGKYVWNIKNPVPTLI